MILPAFVSQLLHSWDMVVASLLVEESNTTTYNEAVSAWQLGLASGSWQLLQWCFGFGTWIHLL